jgi:predicted dehydrogenase
VFFAALEANKHVLCEKPLAVSVEEARDMRAAAEASRTQTAVCFQHRWGAKRMAAWQFVAEGALGVPYYVQVSHAGGYWHPSRPLQSEWMYRLDQGGGYLNGMGSHEIDYLQTLFGRAVAVCADVRSSIPLRERYDGSELAVDADDTSALLMRMESGALAVLTTSVVGCGEPSSAFAAFGSQATIEVSGIGSASSCTVIRPTDPSPSRLEARGRELRSGRAVPSRRSAGAIRAQAFLLEDWLPAFDGHQTHVPTVRDACEVQEVIEAARASSAGAGWVSLPA